MEIDTEHRKQTNVQTLFAGKGDCGSSPPTGSGDLSIDSGVV